MTSIARLGQALNTRHAVSALRKCASAPLISRTFRGIPLSFTRERSHDRKHFERRVLPFTNQQLFDVVADIDTYSEFVPWCTRSKVVQRIDDDHLVADLAVGFQVMSETYTSLVTLEPYRSIKADVPGSSLFNYLINDWTFESGRDKKTTELTFYVEFEFRNPLYQRVTDLFFNEVVKNMVNAFEKRAYVKYRPRHPDTSVL